MSSLIKSNHFNGLSYVFFLIISILFFFHQTFSQVTFEAVNSGNWLSSLTWSGGNIPPITNYTQSVQILMQGSHKNIELNGSIHITNSFAYNFMLNSGTLSVFGNVYVAGSSAITTQGSATLRVYGDLYLGPGSTITCSRPIEIFGNVYIEAPSTVNINGGPFIVHGNYVSTSGTNIYPDAVFAVQGTFEGNLANYNGDGNLYVGSNQYTLIPPVPPQAICTPSYNGPNTSSRCPVGDFVDLANRVPDVYNTYFGTTMLQAFNVTGENHCNYGFVKLSGSTVGVTYQLFRYGQNTESFLVGNGGPLTFTVNTNGNYMIRAVNGAMWRWMNNVAVINLNIIPTIISTHHIAEDDYCAPASIRLWAISNPSTAVLKWYTQLSGGTPVYIGNNYQVILIETTTLYVEAEMNGCVSVRTPIMVEIYPVPSANSIIAY